MSFAGTLRELPPESRLTGGAAAALIFSMVLPWYQVSSIGKADSRSAFQVFTWVEASILLVAAAVLYLVWARAQRMRFHLPGGDGFIVSLAGGWVMVLLIWRLFDKPSISGPDDDRRHRLGHLRRAAGGGCAGGGGRAGARRRAAPSRPTRSPRSPSGRSRSAARASAPTAARASTPRSRRCCASARRRGRATRPSRRGARRSRASEPDDPDEPPPPPDRLF